MTKRKGITYKINCKNCSEVIFTNLSYRVWCDDRCKDQWRSKNDPTRKEYIKRYMLVYTKEYRDTHKEYFAEYRDTHKEYFTKYQSTYKRKRPI